MIFTPNPGFSLGAETVSIATLSNYFDTCYDVADAITHAGVSCGVILMPLLTQFLSDVYGWRGALLILGGLNLHIVVSGALLIPYDSNRRADDGKGLADDTAGLADDITEKRNNKLSVQSLMDAADLHLFTNANFLSLVWISTASGYYCTGWIIYLVPHGANIGFEPYQAAALSTSGGVGHLLGTIIFPLTTKILSGNQILYLFTVIISTALALDPLVSTQGVGLPTYVGLILTSGSFGFSRAIISCACFKVAVGVDYLEDRISNVVAWMYVGYGLGSIASGYVSGKEDCN